jgi:hypothetical protein
LLAVGTAWRGEVTVGPSMGPAATDATDALPRDTPNRPAVAGDPGPAGREGRLDRGTSGEIGVPGAGGCTRGDPACGATRAAAAAPPPARGPPSAGGPGSVGRPGGAETTSR